MALVLRKGDKGKAVREIQGLLNSKAGKLILNADGDFGGKTEAAVKEFQTKMKLKVDGAVGPKTWDALHREALKAQFDNCFPAHDTFSLLELEKFFTGLFKPAESGVVMASIAPQSTKTPNAPQNTIPAPAIAKRTDFKNYQRTSFHGYTGRGYVIKDFKKFESGAIQLRPAVKIIEPSGAIPVGFKNECASYVQYFGIPNTRTWLRGPRVCDFKPGELPEGTVIATLRDGKYYSDYSGRSHVGIYLSHHDYSNYLSSKNKALGVTIMEQYNGHKISKKTKMYAVEANSFGNKSSKSWTDSKGVVQTKRVKWGDDGEEYYVLLTAS